MRNEWSVIGSWGGNEKHVKSVDLRDLEGERRGTLVAVKLYELFSSPYKFLKSTPFKNITLASHSLRRCSPLRSMLRKTFQHLTSPTSYSYQITHPSPHKSFKSPLSTRFSFSFLLLEPTRLDSTLLRWMLGLRGFYLGGISCLTHQGVCMLRKQL